MNSAREIVDLISSDVEANGLDFDDDDEFAWPVPVPAKRRKVVSVQNTGLETVADVATKREEKRGRRRESVDDEIIFTSSPAQDLKERANSAAIKKMDFSVRTAEILDQISERSKSKAKRLGKRKVDVEDVSDDEVALPVRAAKVNRESLQAGKQVKAAQRDKLREDKAVEKEKAKQAREEARAARALERQRAADIASVNRSKMDKRVTTPEMIVEFPLSMDGSSSLAQSTEFLRTADAETRLYSSEIPGIIKYRRKIRADFDEEQGCFLPVPHRIDDEKTIVIYLPARDFAALVSPLTADDETIEQRIDHVRRIHPHCRAILLIEGLDALLAKERNASNRVYQAAVRRIAAEEAARDQANAETTTVPAQTTRKRISKAHPTTTIDEAAIEATLLSLQISHNMQIHHCTSPLDTAETMLAMTQQISLSRYRDPPVLPPAQMAIQPNFCMATGQVATGKGVHDTYLKMLQQVIRITEREAVAIAAVYPDVGSLFRAFRSKGDRVLENIMKEGGGGARGNAVGSVVAAATAAAAERRIGVSASQRLARIFLSLDPAELVG